MRFLLSIAVSLALAAAASAQYRAADRTTATYTAVNKCTNCTVCNDGCKCFGGTYYCADGKCPVEWGHVTPQATGPVRGTERKLVCDGEKCRWIDVPVAVPSSVYGPIGFAAEPCPSGNCGTQSFGSTNGAFQSYSSPGPQPVRGGLFGRFRGKLRGGCSGCG